MTSAMVSVALALAMGSTGGWLERYHQSGPWIYPPQPGYGAGFPNGNPDGYGYVDYGHLLPLREDRTAEYYFPRYWSVPPQQMFLGTYYNPYVMRGQRYIPFTGGGGWHAAGGPPQGLADTPSHPYNETIGSGPQVQIPRFTGRVEAPPINSGGTGLTP